MDNMPQEAAEKVEPFKKRSGQLPTISALISESFKHYKKRLWVLAVINIVPYLIIAILAGLGGLVFAMSAGSFSPTTSTFILLIIGAFIAFALALLIQTWGQVALLYAITDPEQKMGIGPAFRKGLQGFLPYLWLTIIFGLVSMGGYILLIIPGIIFAVWFSLSFFTFAAEGDRGLAALLKSKEYVSGYWWAILGRYIVLALLIFALYIPLIVVSALEIESLTLILTLLYYFFLPPFIFCYTYQVYKDLRSVKGAVSIEGKKRGLWIFMAILPLLAIPVIIGASYYTINQYRQQFAPLLQSQYDFEDLDQGDFAGEDLFGGLDEQDFMNDSLFGEDGFTFPSSGDAEYLRGVLQEYFEENGQYPNSLEELIPYLSSPLDLFDPETNLPFYYQTDQNAADYFLCAGSEATGIKCYGQSGELPGVTPDNLSGSPPFGEDADFAS